jgi:hypothetical protein
MVISFVCTALKRVIKIPSINIALFLAKVGNSEVALQQKEKKDRLVIDHLNMLASFHVT